MPLSDRSRDLPAPLDPLDDDEERTEVDAPSPAATGPQPPPPLIPPPSAMARVTAAAERAVFAIPAPPIASPPPPRPKVPAPAFTGATTNAGDAPAPAPAPQASPPPATAPRDLSEIFPTTPARKRELPPKLRLGLGIAIALLLVVVVFGGNTGKSSMPASDIPGSTSLHEDMVVSAEDLKNRREVHADDFRPKRPLLRVAASPPAPRDRASQAATKSVDEDLAARRARRASDPEDVLKLRKRPHATAESSVGTDEDQHFYTGPVYVTAEQNRAPGTEAAAAPPAKKTLAPAGTVLSAVLVTPHDLGRGASTILAKVTTKSQGVPIGTRFVGTASSSRDRVTIQFRSALLPDGRQLRVEAEAQDTDGAFGLAAPNRDSGDEPQGSVAGDVAKETASDLLTGALPSLAGQTLDRYRRSSSDRDRRRSRAEPTISIPSGTPLQVFLHEALSVDP